MKSIKLTTLVALGAGLFSQVGLADQPCGNYAISTNQPCVVQPQPVYTQQQPVYAQPPQTPCAQQQQQVQQAPMQQAPRYGMGFGLRRNNYGYQQPQPIFGARFQSRRQEAAAPDYGRGFELGVRGIQDGNTLDIGAGLYLRAHQQGGQQRLAIELSADALGADLLTQGAVMLYLNPNGIIKPFGLLGGGLAVNSGDILAQGAVGVDVEISQRLTITGDLRGVESQVANADSAGTSLLLGTLGVARKF